MDDSPDTGSDDPPSQSKLTGLVRRRVFVAAAVLICATAAIIVLTQHNHATLPYEHKPRTPQERSEERQQAKCTEDNEMPEGSVPGTPNHGGCESEVEYDKKASAYAHRPPENAAEAKELSREETLANAQVAEDEAKTNANIAARNRSTERSGLETEGKSQIEIEAIAKAHKEVEAEQISP
ncbi:MAG: hypothetical protein ACRDK2_01115 [Solirubrobacteraceae bacterium]